MFTIAYSIRQSTIHGMGTFAEEKIKRGALVWSFNEKSDRFYTPEELWNSPDPEVAKDVLQWGWYDPTRNLYHCNPYAESRMNHAVEANTGTLFKTGRSAIKLTMIALRDIAAGEEMTCDYRECFVGQQELWDYLLTIAPRLVNEFDLLCSRPNDEAFQATG